MVTGCWKKRKCKFQIWKFTLLLDWKVVSDWFMILLVLLLTNKPTSNDYSIQIDDSSVGWREEIDCWNWIFKPNLDDCWSVIEYVFRVFVMFYNHFDMKYLVWRCWMMLVEHNLKCKLILWFWLAMLWNELIVSCSVYFCYYLYLINLFQCLLKVWMMFDVLVEVKNCLLKLHFQTKPWWLMVSHWMCFSLY